MPLIPALIVLQRRQTLLPPNTTHTHAESSKKTTHGVCVCHLCSHRTRALCIWFVYGLEKYWAERMETIKIQIESRPPPARNVHTHTTADRRGAKREDLSRYVCVCLNRVYCREKGNLTSDPYLCLSCAIGRSRPVCTDFICEYLAEAGPN